MGNFNDLHNVCIKVFDSIANTTTVFVLPLFLARIVFSNILGEGTKSFQALKGVVFYFCLVTGFPIIVEVLFSIPESYLPKPQTLSSFMDGNPGWDMSAIPFSVDRILEVILAALYWVVYYLHIFFMLLMCSMAPVVFLMSTLLGVGLGLEIFIGLLVIGSSWPIIWYGFDQVHDFLSSAQTDAFGAKCLELLLTLFKGLAPVSFAALAVRSPVGQSITKSAHAGIQSAKWAYAKASPAMQIPGRIYQSHRENRIAEFERHQRQFFPGSATTAQSEFTSPDRLNRAKNQFPKNEGVNKNENSRGSDIQT